MQGDRSGVAALAFLGPEGSFSHEAAQRLAVASGLQPTPRAYASIGDVIDSVASGAVPAGIVPVENTLAGYVEATLAGLWRHAASLRIIGELRVPIQLCLCARQGTELPALTRVYSHAMALEQSAAWLREHLPGAERVPVASTALGAARAAAESGTAAVASVPGAERAGLAVLARNVQGALDNATRFLHLVSADAGGAPPPPDAPSLRFALAVSSRDLVPAALAAVEAAGARAAEALPSVAGAEGAAGAVLEGTVPSERLGGLRAAFPPAAGALFLGAWAPAPSAGSAPAAGAV